jgi:hypothetical protein
MSVGGYLPIIAPADWLGPAATLQPTKPCARRQLTFPTCPLHRVSFLREQTLPHHTPKEMKATATLIFRAATMGAGREDETANRVPDSIHTAMMY